jgi:hypothetical protein
VISRQWQERPGGKKLHNCNILTDRGGIDFDIDLDEGDPAQTDDIKLLGKERSKIRWQQYPGDNPAFERVEEPIEIVGKKGIFNIIPCLVDILPYRIVDNGDKHDRSRKDRAHRRRLDSSGMPRSAGVRFPGPG